MDGEIVARVERRRQWTPQEKAALLSEVEAAGGVPAVARRHGISRSLLYNWRSAWKAAALAACNSTAAPAGPGEFIQLGVVADAPEEGSTMRMSIGAGYGQRTVPALAERAGVIEIDLPEGIRVRVDGGVDEAALRRVLTAVRGEQSNNRLQPIDNLESFY